jgi:hypothetical protein
MNMRPRAYSGGKNTMTGLCSDLLPISDDESMLSSSLERTDLAAALGACRRRMSVPATPARDSGVDVSGTGMAMATPERKHAGGSNHTSEGRRRCGPDGRRCPRGPTAPRRFASSGNSDTCESTGGEVEVASARQAQKLKKVSRFYKRSSTSSLLKGGRIRAASIIRKSNSLGI